MTRSDCGTCWGLSQEALSFTRQRARADLAWEWFRLPPDRTLTNADVLKLRVNGMDFLYRPANKWIVDFGRDMTKVVSALYEAPFAHVKGIRLCDAAAKLHPPELMEWVDEPVPGYSKRLVTRDGAEAKNSRPGR